MISVQLLSLLLLAAPGGSTPAPQARASTAKSRPAPSSSRALATKLQTAEKRYLRGEFEGALTLLDAAATETRDERTLGRIHLLRAQCHAALRDTVRSEEALASALESDPEAALDPERVDPALVQQLEDLRARTRGELRVRVNRPGARVLVNGRPMGAAPLRTALPIGRHTVEARSADGRQRDVEQVLVYAGRTSEVALALPDPVPEAAEPAPATAAVTPVAAPPPAAEPTKERPHPVVDVRLGLDPLQYKEGPSIELGGGLQTRHLRSMLHVRLLQEFGLTLRGAAVIPLAERFSGYVGAELPVLFVNDTTAVGLGGAVGAEYGVSQWLGLFGELGARHFFSGALERDRLTLQAGARLRLP